MEINGTNVKVLRRKGIDYCDNRKSNCTTCPLAGKVCISSPYGLMLLPDRTVDFQKFVDDFDFMVFELTRNDK